MPRGYFGLDSRRAGSSGAQVGGEEEPSEGLTIGGRPGGWQEGTEACPPCCPMGVEAVSRGQGAGQGLDLGARGPVPGLQHWGGQRLPLPSVLPSPRVHHSGEVGVGRRGLGGTCRHLIRASPFPRWVPSLRCYAGLMPGPGCSQVALDLKQQAQARQGGCESRSPSPGGPPGAWSLSPLGPRLAASSHSALRSGSSPRSHWPWECAAQTRRAEPRQLRPGELAPGIGSLTSWSLPCSATLPTPHPLGHHCVSLGLSAPLLISGPLDWEPRSRSSLRAEQRGPADPGLVHWVDGEETPSPLSVGLGRAGWAPSNMPEQDAEPGGGRRPQPCLPTWSGPCCTLEAFAMSAVVVGGSANVCRE